MIAALAVLISPICTMQDEAVQPRLTDLVTLRRLHVPAAHMAPTIRSDDVIRVERLSEEERRNVEAGDVIVFENVHERSRPSSWVLRVVATEGQQVQMLKGTLHLDGTPVALEGCGIFDARSGWEHADPVVHRETLPNGRSYAVLNHQDDHYLDDTSVFTVPDDHLFVLGDNRDNVLDSRTSVVRFVPIDRVEGRVLFVGASRSDPNRQNIKVR